MYKRLTAAVAATAIILSLCACSDKQPEDMYEKENAGGTGYGAAEKSALYIDDFYFLTLGTAKSQIELLLGSSHYFKDNNAISPVYTLNNGDSITLAYDENDMVVRGAQYTYVNGESESFFDILVELGILKSSIQESGGEVTVKPGEDTQLPPDPVKPDTDTQKPSTGNEQVVDQSGYFASGMYNYTLIEPALKMSRPRNEIVADIGKPNYFFSHSFGADSYIIDCYNLNDGSKLYIDYGYERYNLRGAAIYKNGSYTPVIGNSWSAQTMPAGFTRKTVDILRINLLRKNMTPVRVYGQLGEPAWYEGSRDSYSDVFVLADGSLAYLGFGSAHNKLTTISIKKEDGSTTLVTLN